MTPEEKLHTEQRIIEVLKTVYDPEIPVDIYSLGLIYRIDLAEDGILDVDMTLTAPNCPVAENLPLDVEQAVKQTEGVNNVQVRLTFEPAWTPDKLSDEAKLTLGLL